MSPKWAQAQVSSQLAIATRHPQIYARLLDTVLESSINFRIFLWLEFFNAATTLQIASISIHENLTRLSQPPKTLL